MQISAIERRRQKVTATVNVFHYRADNIGDRMCGPGQYFWPEDAMNVGFVYDLSAGESAILGGGQVFGQISEYSEKSLKAGCGPLVAWGVGLPVKGREDDLVRKVSSRFALFGSRNYEWRDEIRFVPCASCMSDIFDTVPVPEHEVVVYSHRKKTLLLKREKDVPVMTNRNQNAMDVINFLARGETVVTSSYHGVYWAQLLGRKVICVPYNNKFKTLQHAPKISTEAAWRKDLKYASKSEPLLAEYREINQRFAADVAELLHLDG